MWRFLGTSRTYSRLLVRLQLPEELGTPLYVVGMSVPTNCEVISIDVCCVVRLHSIDLFVQRAAKFDVLANNW